MLAYDGSHILHTAIAYFDVVLVEKGVIFVLSREMFRYQLKFIVNIICCYYCCYNNNNYYYIIILL